MKSLIVLMSILGFSFASSASTGTVTVDHSYTTESGLYICVKSKSCSTGEGDCYNNPRFNYEFFKRRKAIMKDLYTSFTQENIDCNDTNTLSIQETGEFFSKDKDQQAAFIQAKGKTVKMLVYNSAQEAMEEVLYK